MNDTAHFPSPVWSAARLALGGVRYWAQGRTPESGYQSLISLFCQSGGTSNDRLSRVMSWMHPPYQLPHANGVLGRFEKDDLQSITRDLDEQGYHVFEQRLPEDLCHRLLRFALTSRCSLRSMSNRGGAPTPVERYTREAPQGVRYDFSTQDVIDNPDVQSLMADHSFIAVAQSYLRCKPIFDVMGMWWHTAYSQEPDKDAAQFYHFDMDRIKWLKFFVYLTDVGPANGPHCFVSGSQRSGGIPSALLEKGYARLTDAEVEASFAREQLREFTGPRGTVIAEDTRGLHKGKHVASGDRLVLQLQFSNSLYGGSCEQARFSRPPVPALASMLSHYKRLYSNYAV